MYKYLIASSCLLFSGLIQAQINFEQFYPDSLKRKRVTVVGSTAISGYAAGLSFLGYMWYSDKERVDFHLYNDSRGYLQMDKFGHALGAYRESYAAYYALRWSGMEKQKALIWGGPAGLIFQTPIEIFDGLYAGWGFSWSDMAANAFGSALFSTQVILFEEQIIIPKFSFSPSEYSQYLPHYLGETVMQQLVYDYNSHTQWYSINIHSATGWKKVPVWLNFAFGYSGNGMIYEFDNPEYYRDGTPFPVLPRYRQYLLSLDVDLSRIPVRKPWQAKVLRAFNLFKIPFPTLEINRIDKLKFWWVYY